MSFSDFFISNAYAQGGATAQPNGLFLPIMMVVFVVFLYFTVWGPQNKRAKEQRELLSSLKPGDEVTTVSGIVGKISKMSDTYVHLTIADNTDIVIQKQAISNALPKGTLKSI